MSKKTLITLVFLTFLAPLWSQTIKHPNFGLKSHPTLDLESVITTDNSTTLFMVIENRSLDGTFCADKNIFITLPDGKQLKIKETKDIPTCPESYVFKTFGEKLYFSLIFPPIPKGTMWFDLTEDCKENCFSFNSIILNTVLNEEIDKAYALVTSGKTEDACREFEGLLNDFLGKNCPYEGAIYWNLIQLSKQMGDLNKSAEWRDKLLKSDNPLKGRFVDNLGVD
jgi:hypothetical protein